MKLVKNLCTVVGAGVLGFIGAAACVWAYEDQYPKLKRQVKLRLKKKGIVPFEEDDFEPDDIDLYHDEDEYFDLAGFEDLDEDTSDSFAAESAFGPTELDD